MTATRVGRCKSRRHDAMTPAATIVVNRLPALSAHDDSLLALALALFSWTTCLSDLLTTHTPVCALSLSLSLISLGVCLSPPRAVPVRLCRSANHKLNTTNRSLIEFFKLYRQLPGLWNITDDVYKDKRLKKIAQDRLLACYQLIDPWANVDSLRRRLNAIRTSYRRELRKVEHCSFRAATSWARHLPRQQRVATGIRMRLNRWRHSASTGMMCPSAKPR